MKHLLLSAVVVLAIGNVASVRAAEITLIAPGGFRAAIEQLAPAFEQKTGDKVKTTIGSGGGTKERVIKGELFDVPVVQPPLEPVIASGHIVKESETPLAVVWVGIAVKEGARKPDISTAEAVKSLLLGVKAFSCVDPAGAGAAGASFMDTLQRLGIADQVKSKMKPAQGGRVAMAMLAKGEVDIGVTFISEIITEPGVEVVGPLPKEVSTPTGLVGFEHVHSKEPAAAKALLTYLSGPEAAVVYKQRGMVPGR